MNYIIHNFSLTSLCFEDKVNISVQKLSLEQAKEWAQTNPWVSAIRETVISERISNALGNYVPITWRPVELFGDYMGDTTLDIGDTILVAYYQNFGSEIQWYLIGYYGPMETS